MTLEFTWKFGVLSNFFNLLKNGNPEDSEVAKSKITGKSTTSKSERLILITSPSQFQILRLPSPMKTNKVQLSCVIAAQFFFWFIFHSSASSISSPTNVDMFSDVLTIIINCCFILLCVSR